MTETPVLHAESATDVREAYLRHEKQSPGLGIDFVNCVEQTLESIGRNPHLYPAACDTYRRTLVCRFPFATFFEHDLLSGRSIVYAVFHCAHDPEKWRR
jgi:hypothetical protein